MKNLRAIAVAVPLLICAAHSARADELLSMRTIKVGGVEVALPKTKTADGSICVSYLSNTSRDAAGKLNLEVSQVCDKAASVLKPFGTPTEYPAKLHALRIVMDGDLTLEVPDIR